MRRSIFATLCFGTLVYVICVSSMWGELDPWTFHPARFLAWLFYIPSTIWAAIAVVISLFKLLRTKLNADRMFYVGCLIICLPMIAYFSYRPQYVIMKKYYGDYKMLGDFNTCQSTLLPELLRYYYEHPERFHPTGEADIVTIDGFADYLRQVKGGMVWYPYDGQATDSIKTDGDQVLTPWNTPIIFLLNTNHSGYIQTPIEKRSVNEYADPWQRPDFNYSIAVGATVREVPEFMKSYAISQQEPKDVKPPFVVLNDTDYTRTLRNQTEGYMDYLRDAIARCELVTNDPLPNGNSEIIKALEGDNSRKMGFASFNKNQINTSGEVVDQWGTPLRISINDSKKPKIQSAGPDRTWDTSDDIIVK